MNRSSGTTLTTGAPHRGRTLRAVRNGAIALLLLVFVVPFWGAIATSFTDANLNAGEVLLWPEGFTFDNYAQLFERLDFYRFLYNSMVVVLFALLGQILVSILAAFAFGRMEFPGRRAVMLIFISTMIMTETMLMVPLYLILRDLPLLGLNLLGTRAGMILPLIGWAFPIVVLTEFIRDVPRELDDSARVDGAGDATIYVRILLPLVLPAIGTCVIFGFVMIWNQYVLPLIVSPDDSLHTLPVALRNVRGALGHYENVVPMWMAGAVVTMVPSIVVYALLQRSFVQGLTQGGVKG